MVLAAGHVRVDQPRDRRGIEVALGAEALGAQDLAAERLELTPQPRRGGDREAALAPAGDLAAGSSGSTAERSSRFLANPRTARRDRQRERELGDARRRGTARAASSEWAMLIRSVLTSRSSTR